MLHLQGLLGGTYYNVKISTPADAVGSAASFDSNWKGATAKVVVAGLDGTTIDFRRNNERWF